MAIKMITFRDFYIQVGFGDMGKLNPDQLQKGQALDPKKDDNFIQVNGRVFHSVLSKLISNEIAKNNLGLPTKGLHSLSVYKVEDYQKMNCFIGKNNSSGYALKNGELISVFSTQKSSGHAIVADAVKNGADHLDCFAIKDAEGRISGPLYKLYSSGGFVVDINKNEGKEGEPYSVQNGVSYFVDDDGVVNPDDPRVVIFMVIK